MFGIQRVYEYLSVNQYELANIVDKLRLKKCDQIQKSISLGNNINKQGRNDFYLGGPNK